MILKKITINYFMRFGKKQIIPFHDQQLISIMGQWEDNPERSNQSGKSSFIEALTYCLWGETRAKTEKELLNDRYDEDMFVELLFDVEGVEYTLKRGRTTGNKPIIELSGYEENKEIQTVIDKLIGLTYRDFVATCYFMQGDIHTFMEANNAEKNKYILKWFEKGYWLKLEEEAKLKVNELKLLITQNEYDTKANQKVFNTEVEVTMDELEKRKKEVLGEIAVMEKDIKALEDKQSKVELKQTWQDSIISLRKRLENIPDRIELYEEDIENFANVTTTITNLQHNLDDPDDGQIDILIEQEQELFADKKSAENERLRLRGQYTKVSKFEGYCEALDIECQTASEQKVAVLMKLAREGEVNNKLIKSYASDLDKIRSKKDKLKKIIDEYKTKMLDIKMLKASIHRIDVDLAKNNIQALKKEEKQIKAEIATLKGKVEKIEIDFDQEEYDDLVSDYNVSMGILEELNFDIGKQNNIAENIKKAKKNVARLEKELIHLQDESTQWKFVMYMFSKNGIPSNQIESTFDEIQDEVNIILEKLGTDLSVEFSNSKELSSWESHCLACGSEFKKGQKSHSCLECGVDREKKRKNEFQVKIKEGSKETLFHLDSGGGKVLISIAIRIALTRILFRRLGIKFNILILDEVFAQLDAVNRDYVVKLITGYLINEMGFEQIFIISHTEIKNAIPDTILITRKEDYSEVSWL